MTAHKNTCAARFSESTLSCTKIEHLIFLEFLFIKNKISKYSSAILLLTGMCLCRQKQKKNTNQKILKILKPMTLGLPSLVESLNLIITIDIIALALKNALKCFAKS